MLQVKVWNSVNHDRLSVATEFQAGEDHQQMHKQIIAAQTAGKALHTCNNCLPVSSFQSSGSSQMSRLLMVRSFIGQMNLKMKNISCGAGS